MDGLYLAALMDFGWFPLRWLLPVLGLYSPATYARRWAVNEPMSKGSDSITVIVPKYGSETELSRFVRIFHQDFGYLNCDPDEMALGFFRSLSKPEQASLRKDFIKLLDENPGKKQKGLRNAWFRLGAQWWDRKIDLRQSIQRWISKL